MDFYQKLIQNTAVEAQGMYAIPILHNGAQGNISHTGYLSFLGESYHLATQLAPLIDACQKRLKPEQLIAGNDFDILRAEKFRYPELLLNDIRHAGGDADAVQQSQANLHTELMIAYSWDAVQRGNPLGLLSLIHVLDFTCIAIAQRAAANIALKLDLPEAAFSYLHKFTANNPTVISLRRLLNQVTATDDQRALCHTTRAFYLLYGNIFYNLPYQSLTTNHCKQSQQ